MTPRMARGERVASFVLSPVERSPSVRFPKSSKLPLKAYRTMDRGRKSEDQVRKFLGNEVRNAVRNAVPVFSTASDTRLSYIIITMVSSWKQRVR